MRVKEAFETDQSQDWKEVFHSAFNASDCKVYRLIIITIGRVSPNIQGEARIYKR